jgi:hypothetical protein
MDLQESKKVKKPKVSKKSKKIIEEEVKEEIVQDEVEVNVVEEVESKIEGDVEVVDELDDELVNVKKKRGRKPKGYEEDVEVDVEVDGENGHKKRGRKPKPKEKVYALKESNGYENIEEEKSETLILHLPIKSSDLSNSNHPSAFNYQKQPIATYSIDGTVTKSENVSIKITENTTYNDILKESVVEKKDYKVIFEDHMNNQDDQKNLVEEYDKKVKEFKEFKLVHFIKQIPNSNSQKIKEEENHSNFTSNMDEISSSFHGGGTFLKELDEQERIHGSNVLKPNPFMESSHIDEDIIQEHTNKMNKKNLKNIMVEFMNANMYHEWPDQTNIHCWWCSHQFEGPPCCLPEYMRRDKFYVSGCFCTFNCAASYNFSKNDNLVWERYTLLNLMYKKLYNLPFVKIAMAPPREALKMFGGYMSIEEFRDHCIKQDRVFQVVKPPLISIIPKIEENLHPKNRAVNENILQSTQTKLKLTRSKPLISEKSTIQTFMNITRSE